MSERFKRTKLLLGEEAMKKLAKAKVAVFGLGGVGSYTVEALVRSGIGQIHLIDKDTVDESNINRQLIADEGTIGKYKTDVEEERIRLINPSCKVIKHNIFYLPETANEIDFTKFDYVVDAVDTVTAKILIIKNAKEAGVKIISSMGTGNKLDPTLFKVCDISKTNDDPLSKVMRRELKKRDIRDVKVVFSDEKNNFDVASDQIGSVAFVPSVAGLIIAGEVIKDIIGEQI